MDGQYLVFMVVHGICVAILGMIGLYLVLSVRSAFQEDVDPNPLVRKTAGWNALIWALTFAITLLYPLFKDASYEVMVVNVDIMLSMLSVPGVAALLLGLLQMETAIRRYLWLHLLLPLGLVVWCVFDPQPWQLYASAIYWVCYAICLVIWFYRQEIRYHRRLKDLYSDMDHHEIRWVYQLMILFLIYLVLFIIAHLGRSNAMYYVSYAYCIALWVLLTYYVDHHACVVRFWQGAPEAPASETETEAEPAPASDTAAVPHSGGDNASPQERDYSWIGERLHERCELTGLYLQHDLSIDVLASHVATNRTYMGYFLASKGMTYYRYINGLRVEHAKHLMETNAEMGLSSIAFQSGFKSDSTFRRAFAEIEKCMPSEYMKKIKTLEDQDGKSAQ